MVRSVEQKIGGGLYNPENLQLPDYKDPRLISYLWQYSVGSWTHVIALNSAEWGWDKDSWPDVCVEFSRDSVLVDHETDFHLLWPPEPAMFQSCDFSISFEDLAFVKTDSSEVIRQIADLLNRTESLNRAEFDSDDLKWWREEAEAEGCDRLILLRWTDVRYEWKIRGWSGLTLEHLKIRPVDLAQGFSKNLYTEGSGSVLLDTFEFSNDNGNESLNFEDPEYGALVSLASYESSPNEKIAIEAANYLSRFGGPELASFHFPEISLCEGCGLAERCDCDRTSTLNLF